MMKVQTKYGEVYVLTDCPLLDSTERLEWMTEVHESFNNAEQRLQLRDAPRQILSYNYTQHNKEMGDLFNMLYAGLRKQWGIPLKQYALAVPDVVNSDFLQMDTSTYSIDLNVGDYVLIGSDFVEITEIGRYVVIDEVPTYQDGFRLSTQVTTTSATMTPVRICIIDGDAGWNIGGFWSNAAMQFRVLAEDSPEYEAEQPTQYAGHDIYLKPLFLDGDSLEGTLTQQQNIIDGDVGGFQSYTRHAKPRYLKPFKTLMKNKQEYIDFRKFVFRIAGRFRDFWMPVYENTLNITNTGIVYNTLNYSNEYVIEANRKHVAVRNLSGTWSAHEITNISSNSITVSPAINSEITQVCYLGLYRFDTDSIEFQFLGGDVVQSTVLITELDN